MQTTELQILPELEECLPRLSPEQLEKLRESLDEHGMIHGITLCTIAEQPGERFILDGHTRYRVAREIGNAWKVDTDETPHFETVAEAVQWICKFQVARRNLTAEQYNVILARCYKAAKHELGVNQHTIERVDQNDPPSSTAKKVADEFGVSESKVKRAAAKTERLESLGLADAVMDGSVKQAPEPVVDQILQAVAAEPERKEEIVQEAIEAAKANNGRLQAPKKSVAPAHEIEDDEEDDPEAEQAFEELTETIKTLIHQARREWAPESVAELKTIVLEAFEIPLREIPPIMPATVA